MINVYWRSADIVCNRAIIDEFIKRISSLSLELMSADRRRAAELYVAMNHVWGPVWEAVPNSLVPQVKFGWNGNPPRK